MIDAGVEVNSKWWVSFGGAPCLVKVRITDITDKTVTVREHDVFQGKEQRYAHGFLKFIEPIGDEE